MIFRIKNDSRTFWFPTFCINDTSYQSTGYLMLAFVEICLHLFAVYATIQSVRLLSQIAVFHCNMNYMLAVFLLQWFEAIFAKFIMIPYEYGLILIGDHKSVQSWYTTNIDEMIKVNNFGELIPLYIASILLWHYIYTVLVSVIAIGVERTCATIYIHDYEGTPRRHIPITLVFLCNIFSIPFSLLMANNRVSFLIAFGVLLVSMSTVTVMFLIVWRINVKLKLRMESSVTSHLYSLAQQFQIKENYKSMKLVKRLITTGMIYLSFSGSLLILLVFNIIPEIAPFANHMLLNFIYLNPILLCPVLMSCSRSWLRRFWSFGRFVFFRSDEVEIKPTVNETDVYFLQLRNSWI